MNLEAEDKRILSKLAWESLREAVSGGSYLPADPGRPVLLEKRGCFVTLKTEGALRGCLGCFTSGQPLYQTVPEYAKLSATEDPRFTQNRLQTSDVPRVAIEISVLTPLEPCIEPERIVPGVHGIFISSGSRSGCFLPQVATEMNWSAEDFWGYCCRDKAGLDWDAWKRPDVCLMTFTADVFEAEQ